MITPVCQRWRDKRGTYRPAGEVFDPRRYEVAAMPRDAEAKAFVLAHHYEGSMPAARERVGLYEGAELVGVAVFSMPMSAGVLARLPCPADDAVELGRLVLLDKVKANAESWFLARAFAHLRHEGYAGVVSFSDPEPRRDASGRAVFSGHIGVCYQASNAVYTGRATPRTRHLLPDGSILSARALSKIRAQDRGCRYAAEILVRQGAEPLSGDPVAWLAKWLPRLTRTQRHPGNHRYLWALDKRMRRHLPESLPYPKFDGPVAAPVPVTRPHQMTVFEVS
jgi:hypothetical protein